MSIVKPYKFNKRVIDKLECKGCIYLPAKKLTCKSCGNWDNKL
jgi:hypothetical protein